MPELMANNEINWQNYYASYTRTYIERDVRELTQVGDEVKFFQFLAAAAAVNGSLLNIDKKCDNVKNGVTLLLDTLVKWQETYAIPSLSTFGFTIDELKELAGKTDRKKTPVVFTVDEIRKIFTDRL